MRRLRKMNLTYRFLGAELAVDLKQVNFSPI